MAWWQKSSAAFRPASPPCGASGAAISGCGTVNEHERGARRQLEEAQLALQQQRALADRTRNLEKLLDLRDRSNLKTAAAEIIAAGASPDFRTLTIDKGTSDGIGADMAVIAPAGVVGRVVMPSRARREGPAAHRSQRRGGSPGRAIARAGRRDGHGR